jgi:hypothetical protein
MTMRCIALLLVLSGCAQQDGAFPSLAPRPIESRSADPVAPTPVPADTGADPALAATLARLASDLAAAERGFADALPAATRAVGAASGAAVGSEPWVAAQQMVTVLEAAHGPAVSALAEIDSLYVARIEAIAAGKESGGEEALQQAQAGAAASVLDQRARIDGLKARLSR